MNHVNVSSNSDPSSDTSTGQEEEPGVPQYEPDPSKIEFKIQKDWWDICERLGFFLFHEYI